MQTKIYSTVPDEWVREMSQFYREGDGEAMLTWAHLFDFCRYLFGLATAPICNGDDRAKLAGRYKFYLETVGKTDYGAAECDSFSCDYGALAGMYLRARANYEKVKKEKKKGDSVVVVAEDVTDLEKLIEPHAMYGNDINVNDVNEIDWDSASVLAQAIVGYLDSPQDVGAEGVLRATVENLGRYCYLQSKPVDEWVDLLVKNRFLPAIAGVDLLKHLSKKQYVGPLFVCEHKPSVNHFVYDAAAMVRHYSGVKKRMVISTHAKRVQKAMLWAIFLNGRFRPSMWPLIGEVDGEVYKPLSFLVLYGPEWWREVTERWLTGSIRTVRDVRRCGIPLRVGVVRYVVYAYSGTKVVEFSAAVKDRARKFEGWTRMVLPVAACFKLQHPTCRVCPAIKTSSCVICDDMDYEMM